MKHLGLDGSGSVSKTLAFSQFFCHFSSSFFRNCIKLFELVGAVLKILFPLDENAVPHSRHRRIVNTRLH